MPQATWGQVGQVLIVDLYTWEDPLRNVELDTALARGAITHFGPSVLTDWDGSGTVEDIDRVDVGRVEIKSSNDDGLPSGVTDNQNAGVAQISAELLQPTDWSGSPASYYSPFRSDSPLQGYPRDIAPVTVSIGLVTDTGTREETMFTGTMSDASPTGKAADLTAVSSAVRALQVLVQPQAVDGTAVGLTGSWPVSYALHKAGLYASPPPRPGCLLWEPMHGSFWPMLPDVNLTFAPPFYTSAIEVTDGEANIVNRPPTFTSGPFVESPELFINSNQSFRLALVTDPFFNQQQRDGRPTRFFQSGAGNNNGRVEFWVKGDAADIVNYPDTVDFEFGAPTRIAGLRFDFWEGDPSTTRWRLEVVIDTNRYSAIRYWEVPDVGSPILRAELVGPRLPTDGEWHFVGGAWNITGNRLDLAFDNQVFQSTPSPAMSTAGLSTMGEDNFNISSAVAYVPIAEIQVSDGEQANVALNPTWVNDNAYWNPSDKTAILIPSTNRKIKSIAEPAPLRAIDLISKYAQAELAQTGVNVRGQYMYLPMSYWAEPAQQLLAETLSTDDNVGTDLSAKLNVVRINNEISVEYSYTNFTSQAGGSTSLGRLYEGAPPVVVYPGDNVVRTAFSTPALTIESFSQVVDQAFLDANPDIIGTFWQMNSDRNGSGVDATSDEIEIILKSWNPGSAVWSVINHSTTAFYFTGTVSRPPVIIAGVKNIVVTDSVTSFNPESIDVRGSQGLAVQLPGISDVDYARLIANTLSDRFAQPRATMAGTAMGDPRRSPGDVARFIDADLGLDEYFRLTRVDTSIGTDASFTQNVTGEQHWPIAVWDETNWGEGIWAP